MIGIVDVDSLHFPNFALMRISAFYKHIGGGDSVEWATPFVHYDKVYASKIFTFTEDFNYLTLQADEIHKGGTGYDVKSRLPEEIENSLLMDYSIYPKVDYSVQFFSRGCIRKCPFCLVRDKEGYIQPVDPVELTPNGKWIEVLDNNFFANPEWRSSIDYLLKLNQPVNLHGVDVRIMDAESIVTEVLSQRDEDFSIESESRSNIKEIISSDCDGKLYKIRVDMVTYDDKANKEKRAAYNVLVEADGVEYAIDSLRKDFKGTICDYEIISVTKTAICEVLRKDE